MKTIHVLHVSQPVTAGVAYCVADYAAHQFEHGLRVTVACPDGQLSRLAAERGAQVVTWEASRDPGPGVPGEAVRLRRLIRELRPDVVHLHSSKAGMVGRLVLRGSIPTVFAPHAWSFFAVTGRMRRIVLGWERLAARWTQILLCCSEDERRIGVESGIRGRYEVLPNEVPAVSVDPVFALDRAAVRASLGLAAGVPVAVCTARLARQKGQDILVGIWPRVRAAVPGAELVLVGEGDDRPALEAAAGPGVRFAGPADRDTAWRWLHAADLVVCPSRWEGMSLVALEAMALGRPMVVTDIAGMAEVIPAGGAVVVPPEDPDAFAAGVVTMLADRPAAEEAGRLNRKHALAGAAGPTSADRLIDLYRQLTG